MELGVAKAVELPLSELEAVLLGEAPAVREAVGEVDTVEEALKVVVGVGKPVAVLLDVGVPDCVGLGVGAPLTLPLTLPLNELEPVLLADAPTVSDAVGEADCVEEALGVVLGVSAAVPVPVPVCVMVKLALGVCVAEGEPLKELEPVLEGEAPGVRGGVAEDDREEEALSVEEGVTAAVPLLVGVGGLDGVPVPV